MSEDTTTLFLRRAINTLFIKNAEGTSLGILLGFIIDGFLRLFLPAIPANYIDIEFLKSKTFTAILCLSGVFSFNIKPYFDRHKIPPEIEIALAFIKQRELNGELTKVQAQMEYQALVKKVVSEVTLNDKIQKQLDGNQPKTE